MCTYQERTFSVLLNKNSWWQNTCLIKKIETSHIIFYGHKTFINNLKYRKIPNMKYKIFGEENIKLG